MSDAGVWDGGLSWRVTGLHHVAFAHQGTAALDQLTHALHLRCASTEAAPGFIERMIPLGDSYLQLLEDDGQGVIRRFLDRRGPALHHVAITVDDIDAALTELRSTGTRLVDEHPRTGGGGTRVAFLHPSACGGLLIELVQEPDQSDRAGAVPGASLPRMASTADGATGQPPSLRSTP